MNCTPAGRQRQHTDDSPCTVRARGIAMSRPHHFHPPLSTVCITKPKAAEFTDICKVADVPPAACTAAWSGLYPPRSLLEGTTETVTVAQLVSKFPAVHDTQGLITWVHKNSVLSQINPLRTLTPYFVLILFSHLRLVLPSCLIPSGFRLNFFPHLSSCPCVLHSSPSYAP
jgi:hypothetical protein